jgi:hypothetical protein
VRQENAAERVRRRIAAWIKASGHGSQTKIANTVTGLYGVPRSASWVTDIKKGRQDVRLSDLDGIAKAMEMQPGDLVRKEGHAYAELTASEARLLKYYRAVPDVVRGHWISTLDYLMEFHDRAMQDQAAERDKRTQEARDALRRKA